MASSSSIAKRPNGKYRARYRDDAGKEHAATSRGRSTPSGGWDEATAG